MKVELLDGFWSFCPAKGQKRLINMTSPYPLLKKRGTRDCFVPRNDKWKILKQVQDDSEVDIF